MALPREVVPNRSLMITKRCSERRMGLRPDDETNEAFFYCLGLAADKAGVDLLFTLANSNHHHTGIYDRHGTYPVFLEHFHKFLAKCMNAIRGRSENFWAPAQANVVELADPEDVLAKMTYAHANPVKDHLVQYAHQWPGATSLHAVRNGTDITVRRPRHFFSEEGNTPEFVTLRFVRPPGFEDWSQERWAAELDRRIAAVEEHAAAELRRSGGRVMGRAAVRRQAWNTRPTTRERRRSFIPRLAAASQWARAEALQRSKAFLVAYRRARDAFMEGREPIPFPPGTYLRNKPKIIARAWFATAGPSGTAAA